MARRVYVADAGRQYGNGEPASIERRAVCNGVYANRQPAHYHYAAASQLGC